MSSSNPETIGIGKGKGGRISPREGNTSTAVVNLRATEPQRKRGQDKVVQLWHTNCQQLLTHDSEMLEKDREIRKSSL